MGAVFEPLLNSAGTELPWAMKLLLSLSAWFKSGTFWVGFVVVIAGVITAYRMTMKVATARLLRDRLLISCPFVKHFVKENLVASFSRVFETMLEAGVPLQEALEAARDTTQNELLRQTISRVMESVSEGGKITPALEKAGVFPAVAYDLIAIGEEAAELDRVFGRMANIYEEKIDTDTTALSKLVTPVVVIILGIVVGFIVIALFSTYITALEGFHAVPGVSG